MKKHGRIYIILLLVLLMIPLGILLHRVVGVMSFFHGVREASRTYEPYSTPSYDGKYILQTIKIETDATAMTKFIIKCADTDEIVYNTSGSYRVYDLAYMNWWEDTYDVYVDSHDIGSYLYRYDDGKWRPYATKDVCEFAH